jgi:hypothetical protein
MHWCNSLSALQWTIARHEFGGTLTHIRLSSLELVDGILEISATSKEVTLLKNIGSRSKICFSSYVCPKAFL